MNGRIKHVLMETTLQYAIALLVAVGARLFVVHSERNLAAAVASQAGDMAVMTAIAGGLIIAALAGMAVPLTLVRGLFFVVNLVQVAQCQHLLATGSYASLPLVRYAVLNPGDASAAALSSGYFYVGPLALILITLLMAGAKRCVEALRQRPWAHRPFALMSLSLFTGCLWAAEGFSNYRYVGALTSVLGIGHFGAGVLPGVVDPLPDYQAPALGSEPGRRPDVVILILESTRADVVEGAAPLMPNLQQFGAGARVFSNGHTSTSHTSKALVGIHCGMYPNPDVAILENEPERLPLVCLPKILEELGYKTFFLQSADGSFENRYGLVENLGFSSFVPREKLGAGFKNAGYLGKDERALLEPIREAAKSAGSAPMLLTVLTSTTHYPYVMPGVFRERFSPRLPNAQENYRQVLGHTDDFFKQFVELLDDMRDPENLLLFVVSDHGEAFGEHGTFVHDQTSFQEVSRGIMMIRYPGVVEPGVDHQLRQGIDILPTVLDALQIPWEGSIPGVSLLDEAGHDYIVTSCWNPNNCQAAIDSNGIKVIENFGRLPRQLFDLRQDPLEMVNLSASPDHAVSQQALLLQIARQRDFVARAYDIDAVVGTGFPPEEPLPVGR